MDSFLKETNAMHKDIKIIVEKGNKIINYLDLTLTVNRKHTDFMALCCKQNSQ